MGLDTLIQYKVGWEEQRITVLVYHTKQELEMMSNKTMDVLEEVEKLRITETISANLVRFSEDDEGVMTNFPYQIKKGPLPGYADPTVQDQENCRRFLKCKSYGKNDIIVGGRGTNFSSVQVQNAMTLGPD